MNATALGRSALADDVDRHEPNACDSWPRGVPSSARPGNLRMAYTAGSSPDPRRICFGPIELDEAEARLTVDGHPVPLPPRPFAVLCALAREPHTLLTKNALLDAVWGHRFVTESVLKSAISEVRAALDDDPKQPRYIETVSRRGYRFIASTIGAASQRAPAIERNVVAGRDHPTLTALTAMCRCDAALAELIRAVAAKLEREPLVLNESC